MSPDPDLESLWIRIQVYRVCGSDQDLESLWFRIYGACGSESRASGSDSDPEKQIKEWMPLDPDSKQFHNGWRHLCYFENTVG